MSELENDEVNRQLCPWTHFLGHLKLKSRFWLNGMTGDEVGTLDIAVMNVAKRLHDPTT
jgi:hypothetical protein